MFAHCQMFNESIKYNCTVIRVVFMSQSVYTFHIIAHDSFRSLYNNNHNNYIKKGKRNA